MPPMPAIMPTPPTHQDPALLLRSLPESFDFYHLGRMELAQPREPSALSASEDRLAVAFAIRGETAGALVLLIEPGLDLSTYSEAGNIIASRLVTSLETRHGITATLSPPRFLTQGQLRKILANDAGSWIARTYVHHRKDGPAIALDALLLPTSVVPSEGTGNA